VKARKGKDSTMDKLTLTIPLLLKKKIIMSQSGMTFWRTVGMVPTMVICYYSYAEKGGARRVGTVYYSILLGKRW